MGYHNAISSDDPQAVEKLQAKLESLQQKHALEKKMNSYYKKHGTVDGCEGVSVALAAKVLSDMKKPYHLSDVPIPAYQLQSNNQEIRRLKQRIEKLEYNRDVGFVGWTFPGGKAEPNTEENRLQLFFDEKPTLDMHKELLSNGFVYSYTNNAYQRKLGENAIYAARRMDFVRPEDGTDPVTLQPKAPQKKAQER